IPRDKRIVIALTSIYGIGKTSAQQILEAAEVSEDTRVRDLTEEELGRIRKKDDSNYTNEGDLRREASLDLKRLTEIGSYRALRKRKKLPRRSQKTKNYSRTRKGPRIAIAGKKD